MTVTVTHNREEGRRDRWEREGEGTRKGAVGEGAGPPRLGAEGGEDGGQRDQREGGRGNGGGLEGNPANPRRPHNTGACDWPHVAMVAGAASTEGQ